MNYNSEILVNKDMDIVKRGLSYLAVAMCVVLTIALIMFKFLGFQGYVIMSPSMEPVYNVQDLIVVKKADDYKIGDVLKFALKETSELPTTHRCLGIETIAGVTYYICIGDNNPGRIGSYFKEDITKETVGEDWSLEYDINYIKNLKLSECATLQEAKSKVINVQFAEYDQISGKVIGYYPGAGKLTGFVSKHPLLLITVVIAIWCVTESYNSEQEIKRAKRLFK